MKPVLVLQAPIFTRSGYGDHSRDILKSLRALDRWDIKLVPTKWGSTPQNNVPTNEFGQWMLDRIVTKLDQRPDVFVQISVANEFKPVGNFNIGITAGVETTLAPKDFIDGCNSMDLIIVPSEFTKKVLEISEYSGKNKYTGKDMGTYKLTTPIEVLFEGVDIGEMIPKSNFTGFDNIDLPEFNFLIVGHWMKGNLGEDRKNIGMTIKTINTVFGVLPEDKKPGIVLKTSGSSFSLKDRKNILDKIDIILDSFSEEERVPIYLIHGDLTNEEMGQLYHHPKMSCMVSFTKGEGYGRPLAEFALTGKPIAVSNFSGHIDFLDKRYTQFLPGRLTNVDSSVVDKFLIKESKWFTVDYSSAAKILLDIYSNYDKYLSKSKHLTSHIKNNFSLEQMTKSLDKMLDKYIEKKPKAVPINLPKINKEKG